MNEDFGPQEFQKTVVATKGDLVSTDDGRKSVSFPTLVNEESHTEPLDDFIENVQVTNIEGEPLLEYINLRNERIIVTNDNDAALTLLNDIYKSETRYGTIPSNAIYAQSKIIELEDRSRPVKDWKKEELSDMKLRNYSRIVAQDGRINLNRESIAKAFEEDMKVIEDRVRIKYSNRKKEEKIYYFPLTEASKLADLSRPANYREIKNIIDIKQRNLEPISFQSPRFENNIIANDKYGIPLEAFERPIHKEIIKEEDSFVTHLYISGSGQKYRIKFNLEDYNRLLREIS